MPSANTAFQEFVATATASTTNGTNVPAFAIDNNGTTYWESTAGDAQAGGGPWLQVDLTRILKVYGIVVTFNSAGTNKPANFLLETSDNPTDQAYGTYRGSGAFDLIGKYPAPSGSTGTYGEFNIFVGTTSAGVYGVATTQSTGSFHPFDARYIRIQNAATSQMRIVDIQVWAASPRQNSTTARVRVGGYPFAPGIVSGGTLFSQLTNDLMDVDVMQMLGRQVWSGTAMVNNTRSRYTRADFPEGTPVKMWLDGNAVLLGQITNFDPKFSLKGLTANIEVRGYDDFLNQDIRYAWAATPISDKTSPADILSNGPNSVLGQTLNSVGSRVIGNLNTLNAQIGPNIVVYYPAKDIPKFQVINDLAETAMDGAWILQNTNFSPTLATYGTTLGRAGAGVSDGYWFGIKTRPGYLIDLRTPVAPNSMELGALSAVVNGGNVVPADTNPKFTWDGNVGNDALYNYVEVFQSVFFIISTCSQAGSLTFQATAGTRSRVTGGGGSTPPGAQQVDELIVEAEDKIGRLKRLHYIVGAAIVCRQNPCSSCTANFNYSGGNIVYPPPDTDADKYIDLTGATPSACVFGNNGAVSTGLISRNLYSDWTTRFVNTIDSGGSDTVTVIRIRSIPFAANPIDGSDANQAVNTTQWSNVAIVPVAHVKTPPVRYDFYVHESSVGSQVPDLFFFPRPRANIDLTYRNLDGSNNLRWYTTQASSPTSSLGSDFNNIETFEFMKGDVYRVKNDTTTIGGQAITLTDKATIDATNFFYLSRVPSTATHASRQEQINIADMASITSIGRRQKFITLAQTDPVELVRETVKLAYQNRITETRGTVKTRGNSNLAPGYIITVESDYPELAGKYLIHQVQHKWNQNGYMTTLNLEDIDFLMTNEFARAQASIYQAAGNGGRGTVGNLKSATFLKNNADRSGFLVKSLTGATTSVGSMDYNQFSLPLNTINEFSNIRYDTITISKMLGGENNGTMGTFGFAGGTQFAPLSSIGEDVFGWTLMPNEGDNSVSATQGLASATKEVTINDQNYFAQRFMSTQSTGGLMVRFRGRLPTATSTSAANHLLLSIWSERADLVNNPPFQPDKPYPGGTNDPGAVGFNFFWGVTSKPPGFYRNPNVVSGWTSIPFSLLPRIGADASQATNPPYAAVAAEIGLQTPIPPGTAFWLVMRVNSAGQNFYVGVADISAGIYTQAAARKSSDSGNSWTSLGAPANGFLLAHKRIYGLASLGSFGAWQPSSSTVQVHFPGTVGVSSAAAGLPPITILPIITDKNGARMDVTNATHLTGQEETNPGTNLGSGLYTIEPVTGQPFVAYSIPGQTNQLAQIAFPTSQIAARDLYGDVLVSAGAFISRMGADGTTTNAPYAGTTIGDNGSAIRRMDYTFKVDYNEF